ncbi:FkbM family methyltransferase [Fibrobacterota bacterium]
MNWLLKALYAILPKRIIDTLGASGVLRPLRDFMLRPQGREKLCVESIHWKGYNFRFTAPISIAVKAKKKGIESTLLTRYLHYQKDDFVILDVGANYGFLSLVFGNSVEANHGRVFSFEPDPETYQVLTQNIRLNQMDNTILTFNLAVCASGGKVAMEKHQTSSVIADKASQVAGAYQIDGISLDEFTRQHSLDKVDFIKIDVDGAELEVLRGALGTIKQFRPIIVIEIDEVYEEVGHLLKDIGYRYEDLWGKAVDLAAMEGVLNVFCIPLP